MARPGMAASRNLSLMEELEKLEQSITLTLQEIDHNFSKAHRIVSTSIIPVVEQYGEHSRAVWEASKFWKQFFEASANVSLSGYEELANDDETTVMEEEDESTAMRDESTTDLDPSHDDLTATPRDGRRASLRRDNDDDDDDDRSLLEDAEMSGSTPHPPSSKAVKADLPSHGTLSNKDMKKRGGEEMGREEEEGTTVLQDEEEDDSTVLFAQRTAQLPDISMTPRRNKDPLLHRVSDKNYRVQATPHRTEGRRMSPTRARLAGDDKGKGRALARVEDEGNDSLMSSPDMAPPTLRSEVFLSPFKLMARQRAAAAAAAAQGPRTPGVSVQTPAMASKSRDVLPLTRGEEKEARRGDEPLRTTTTRQKYEIDWDSDGGNDDDDGDLYAGMSPPKTIQFALPPSKLLQTPAREASRRIVGDILLDAGADPESSEYSPTMVKMNENHLDESF